MVVGGGGGGDGSGADEWDGRYECGWSWQGCAELGFGVGVSTD